MSTSDDPALSESDERAITVDVLLATSVENDDVINFELLDNADDILRLENGAVPVSYTHLAIRTLLTEAADTENAPEKNGWLSQTAVYYLLDELELYAGQYGQAAIYAEKIRCV